MVNSYQGVEISGELTLDSNEQSICSGEYCLFISKLDIQLLSVSAQFRVEITRKNISIPLGQAQQLLTSVDLGYQQFEFALCSESCYEVHDGTNTNSGLELWEIFIIVIGGSLLGSFLVISVVCLLVVVVLRIKYSQVHATGSRDVPLDVIQEDFPCEPPPDGSIPV
jgi:hypothetical protein